MRILEFSRRFLIVRFLWLSLLLGWPFPVRPEFPKLLPASLGSRSFYVEMRDGVRIAIDVWLPEDLRPGQKIPAMMRMTRYWRAQDRVGATLTQD